MSGQPQCKLGGWRRDREDFRIILPMTVSMGPLRTYGLNDLYTVADPTTYFVDNPEGTLAIENQQQTNSCVGHGGSTIMEHCLRLKYGRKDQLSRWYAYIKSQRVAGIRGDNGSTISAMVKVASQGVCLESLCPFTGRYFTDIPAAAEEDARRFKIASSVHIESIQDDQVFLGKNIGGMIIGVPWTSSFDSHPSLIEDFRDSGGGGGHCVGIPFLSPRTDSNGDHYAWLINSWGERWGNKGWKEISPTARRKLYRHNWVEMWGVSDMSDPRPRAILPLST